MKMQSPLILCLVLGALIAAMVIDVVAIAMVGG